MGVIKQGILGGFSGKVGSVVGTSWKGRAVMKAMPLSVANPRTTGQVVQRNKMTGLVGISKSLLGGTIAIMDNPFSGNISGYNRFVKRNISKMQDNGSAYANDFDFSEGVLGKIKLSSTVVANAGSSIITISWTSENSPYNLDTDKVIIAVVNRDLTEVLNAGTHVGSRSTTGTTVVSVKRALTPGGDLYVIAMAIREDKKYCSNSSYENIYVS